MLSSNNSKLYNILNLIEDTINKKDNFINIFNVSNIIYNELDLNNNTLFSIPIIISENKPNNLIETESDCKNLIYKSLTALQSSSTPLITPKSTK